MFSVPSLVTAVWILQRVTYHQEIRSEARGLLRDSKMVPISVDVIFPQVVLDVYPIIFQQIAALLGNGQPQFEALLRHPSW